MTKERELLFQFLSLFLQVLLSPSFLSPFVPMVSFLVSHCIVYAMNADEVADPRKERNDVYFDCVTLLPSVSVSLSLLDFCFVVNKYISHRLRRE